MNKPNLPQSARVWDYLGGKWISFVFVTVSFAQATVLNPNQPALTVNFPVAVFVCLLMLMLANLLALLCSFRVADVAARAARQKRIVFWWMLVVLLATMGSCATQLADLQTTAVPDAMGMETQVCEEPGGRPTPLPPITDEDKASALAFGRAFERALRERDRIFVSTAFDDSIIRTLIVCHVLASDWFKRLASPSPERAGVLSGLRKGLAKFPDSFADTSLRRKLDLIEFREVRNRAGLLFRARESDRPGFTYIEYQLRRTSAGDPGWRIIDWYNHAEGSYGSDNILGFAGTAFPVILHQDTDALHFANLRKMNRLQALGDPESLKNALDLWDTIPPELQKAKFAKVIHLMTQGRLFQEALDPEPYLTAIDDFERAFPNDPARMIWSIYQSLGRDDYDGARSALRTLRQSIPDPYLDFWIGWVDLLEEDYDAVVERARAFIRLEPEDQEGYEMLLQGGLGQGNHEIAAQALAKLESDFGQDYSGVFEAAE